jgi:hypothetical protein
MSEPFSWDDRITHRCAICGLGYKWVPAENPITVCLQCGGEVIPWTAAQPAQGGSDAE